MQRPGAVSWISHSNREAAIVAVGNLPGVHICHIESLLPSPTKRATHDGFRAVRRRYAAESRDWKRDDSKRTRAENR